MTADLRRVTFSLLVALSFVACTTQPVARIVAAGTTFMVPFVGNGIEFPVAYGVPSGTMGTVLSTDPQRGESRFALCIDATCSTQRPLTLKYVTRLSPDRGSHLGRSGAVQITPSGMPTQVMTVPGQIFGQDFAVLDVPINTQIGTYKLTYFLKAPGKEEQRAVLGDIRIVAAVGSSPMFTDVQGALNLPGFDLTPSLQGFLPDPQISLNLVDSGRPDLGGDMDDLPAAGVVVLLHPERVEIKGAFENGVLGQGSVVRTQVGSTRTTISFVDPDRKISSLRVSFTLKANQAPVQLSDFSIEEGTERLYRSDGSLIPFAATAGEAGNSFVKGLLF